MIGRGRAALGVVLVASGAAIAARWWSRPPAVALQPAIEVRAHGRPTAGDDRTVALLGDRIALRATASQLWVFRGDELIATCPGPACARRPGGFALSLAAAQPGRHRVLAIVGPVVAPRASLDELVLAARASRARLHLAIVDVVQP